MTPTVTMSVAATVAGAAAGGDPSGTSPSMPNMIGIRVTGINMITVPQTVGVSTRRSSDNCVERPNWNSARERDQGRQEPGAALDERGDAHPR